MCLSGLPSKKQKNIVDPVHIVKYLNKKWIEPTSYLSGTWADSFSFQVSHTDLSKGLGLVVFVLNPVSHLPPLHKKHESLMVVQELEDP